MLIGELVINFARHCDTFFFNVLKGRFYIEKKYSEFYFNFYNQIEVRNF